MLCLAECLAWRHSRKTKVGAVVEGLHASQVPAEREWSAEWMQAVSAYPSSGPGVVFLSGHLKTLGFLGALDVFQLAVSIEFLHAGPSILSLSCLQQQQKGAEL